jgi:hypothetical protein
MNSRSTVKPVFNSFRYPLARYLGPDNRFDPARSILVGIDDDHFSRTGRRMPAVLRRKAAFELIMESTAEYEMGVQVSGWQGIPQKHQLFRGAQHVGAIVPKALEDRTLEIFEISRWHNEGIVASSHLGLDATGSEEGFDAFPPATFIRLE